MNTRLDELAEGLAQSVTRRQALKKFGVWLAGMALACSGVTQAQTFTTIAFPGADDTIATSINRTGTIVGDFRYAEKGIIQGYVLNQGAFTTIRVPGANYTSPRGINDAGAVVGVWNPDNGNSHSDHGFVFVGGVFIMIDFPGANATDALGIDNAGEIFGGYCDSGTTCYFGGSVHGFVMSNGVFTAINFPGALLTEAWGRDGAGRIAGRYQDAKGIFHVFLLSNGTFATVDFPSVTETAQGWYTLTGGFSLNGAIASTYCSGGTCSEPGPGAHGFLLSGGQFTSFDFPGSQGTAAWGINLKGDIVGGYISLDGSEHGFLRTGR